MQEPCSAAFPAPVLANSKNDSTHKPCMEVCAHLRHSTFLACHWHLAASYLGSGLSLIRGAHRRRQKLFCCHGWCGRPCRCPCRRWRWRLLRWLLLRRLLALGGLRTLLRLLIGPCKPDPSGPQHRVQGQDKPCQPQLRREGLELDYQEAVNRVTSQQGQRLPCQVGCLVSGAMQVTGVRHSPGKRLA